MKPKADGFVWSNGKKVAVREFGATRSEMQEMCDVLNLIGRESGRLDPKKLDKEYSETLRKNAKKLKKTDLYKAFTRA